MFFAFMPNFDDQLIVYFLHSLAGFPNSYRHGDR